MGVIGRAFIAHGASVHPARGAAAVSKGTRWGQHVARPHLDQFHRERGVRLGFLLTGHLSGELLDVPDAVGHAGLDDLECFGIRFGRHFGQFAHVGQRLFEGFSQELSLL